MKISEFKEILSEAKTINFKFENGTYVPAHFHITEIGLSTKHFIDCGGTERQSQTVTFQLWCADDLDHRLSPAKLLEIIGIGEKKLSLADHEIEVEYQSDTVGKYNIEFADQGFMLKNTHTDCLAKDNCGIPVQKPAISVLETTSEKRCTPGGGCC